MSENSSTANCVARVQRLRERINDKALNVAAAPVLTVALGDSVTQGAMEFGTFAPDQVYHHRLQRLLESHHPMTTFSTLNAGVCGSSAPQALERLERDVISHQPDLVLVGFGLNDSLGGAEGIGRFEDALEQIVSRVSGQTQALILLLTPPHMATQKHLHRIHPSHHDFADKIIAAQTGGSLASYAEAVRQVAQRRQVLLADVHAEWTRLKATGADLDLWLTNGLNHPDHRGHALAAQTVYDALRDAYAI